METESYFWPFEETTHSSLSRMFSMDNYLTQSQDPLSLPCSRRLYNKKQSYTSSIFKVKPNRSVTIKEIRQRLSEKNCFSRDFQNNIKSPSNLNQHNGTFVHFVFSGLDGKCPLLCCKLCLSSTLDSEHHVQTILKRSFGKYSMRTCSQSFMVHYS